MQHLLAKGYCNPFKERATRVASLNLITLAAKEIKYPVEYKGAYQLAEELRRL